MGFNKLDRISYGIFGRRASSRAGVELAHKSAQARIGVPVGVYISRAYFLSILLSLPLGLLVYAFMRGEFTYLLGSSSFLIIPLLSFLFGLMVYDTLLFYPSFEAKLRGSKIDIIMPHAIALMHALSRGSSDVTGFFEIIGNNKKMYGEVSEEVRGILVDTKILNLDLKAALKNCASSTPSESFKNFLESLSTIITSGGNLVEFFLSKSEQYRLKALNESKTFIDTLGLIAEIYVTGFAAGPLFITVLLMVLGLVGGTQYYLLLSIVYLLIPGGSMLFIVFLSSLEEGTCSSFAVKSKGNPDGNSENSFIQKAKMRMQIHDFLSDPFKKLIETPEKILYYSVPLGLIFFVLTTYNYYSLEFNQLVYEIDDYIIFTALIIFVPYTLLVEAHFRRIDRISKNFPEFLNRLASLHESGLTLPASLKRLKSSNLGILNSEINKINTDIELNCSIVDAFRNFGKRVNSVSLQRVALLIENASRVTGNIKDSLMIAATDAVTARSLEEEKKRYAQMHVIILYIAFFVFLYVIWSLVKGFLLQVPEVQSNAVAEMVGGSIVFSGIDRPLYVRLFFHASVLEGFFSGLVAGQIGEGDVRLGLKHSLIMTITAYALFMFIA